MRMCQRRLPVIRITSHPIDLRGSWPPGHRTLTALLATACLALFLGSQPAVAEDLEFEEHLWTRYSSGFPPVSQTTTTGNYSFDASRCGERFIGTAEVTFPKTLSGTWSGDDLLLSSPQQTMATFRLQFIVPTVEPPDSQTPDSSYRLTVSTMENASSSNSVTCENRGPIVDVRGGTHDLTWSVQCTWNKVTAWGSPRFSNFRTMFDITTFNKIGICGYTLYAETHYREQPAIDLTVNRIEVVQVVQDEQNSIPLVAEKGTVARVFVKGNPIPPLPVLTTARLHGIRGGVALSGSPLSPQNGPVLVTENPDRNTTDSSLNFKLPESWTEKGTVTLRAEVNPSGTVLETDRSNNTREQQATFATAPVFLVKYLRVCYRVPTLCPSAAFVAGQSIKARKLFPTDDTFFLYEPLATSSTVWKGTLLTGEGEAEFMADLRKRWELVESTDGAQPDQLIGWLPSIAGASGVPSGNIAWGMSDPVWFGSTGRVAFVQAIPDNPGFLAGEGGTAHTLAHEMAHNLGLRHTNTSDCNGCRDKATDWPYPNGRVQEPGFDPLRMVAVPKNWFDVMTYVSQPKIWIAPFHYDKLVKGKLHPKSTKPVPVFRATPNEYLLVSGMAKRDGSGGRLDPLIRFTSSTAPPEATSGGNHCIRVSSASSTADHCFTLTFERHGNRLQAPIEEEAFVVKIPSIDGLTTVSLLRGENELARLTASSNAPAVQITSPAAGETWKGMQTVRWSGTDADGDALTYTLLYTSDGGTTWMPMETNLQATEVSFETAEIVAGSQIQFRVIASDGIRTAEATSPSITVTGAPILEATESTDFGTLTLGSTSDRAITVMNRGSKAVTLTAATSTSSDFRVLDAFPMTLGERKSVELTVRFSPAESGTRASTIAITTNEPGLHAPAASVYGSGVATPALELDPSSLSFASLATGASSQQTITLRNRGLGPLSILELMSDNSQFRTEPPGAPFVIAAGAAHPVTVTFTPAAPGSHTANLRIVSDSTTGPLTTAVMTGSATGSVVSCFAALSTSPVRFTNTGGSGSIEVTAGDGCAWTLTSSSDWVAFPGVASGSGAGRVDFTIRQNSGAARSARIGIADSGPFIAINQDGGAVIGIIPAIASSPGAPPSFFKTAVQLHNPEATPISGALIFHPGSTSGTPEDPSLWYALEPGETISWNDALAEMSQGGIGSADLSPRVGGIPVSSIRIFNDAGEDGTTGMTEQLLAPDAALEARERGILIAPPEPSRARFNIGFRTLAFGADMTITIRDKDGNLRTTVPKGFPANFFGQQGADAFLGLALQASDSISIVMNSGSAIVYGATNDNTTQDPSLQFARPLPVDIDSHRVIPVVAAVRGAPPSLFRTAVQLHNPSSSTINGRLIFHPAGLSASPQDPVLEYTLPPATTLYYPDVLTAFNREGLGSVDVIATTGSVPVTVTRIFNDAGVDGTTGFSAEAMRPGEALQPGQSGVLIAPPDPSSSRFNIGLRTMDAGVSMTVTVRSATGTVKRTFDAGFGPDYFQQQSAAAFLGISTGANDTVTITVHTGSAIVYGAATDNITQDPAMQIANGTHP